MLNRMKHIDAMEKHTGEATRTIDCEINYLMVQIGA
jgi:hypothetical protein